MSGRTTSKKAINGDTQMENETNAQPQAEAAKDPGLTVQDLQAIKAIIDVASSRGAFKPNEMIAVGQTYTKLEQFLVSVAPKEAQS